MLPITQSAIITICIGLAGGIAKFIYKITKFIIQTNKKIEDLQKEKTSKEDVCSIIDEKLLQQYKELSKEILFISRCVKCLAKDLKINIPLD